MSTGEPGGESPPLELARVTRGRVAEGMVSRIVGRSHCPRRIAAAVAIGVGASTDRRGVLVEKTRSALLTVVRGGSPRAVR